MYVNIYIYIHMAHYLFIISTINTSFSAAAARLRPCINFGERLLQAVASESLLLVNKEPNRGAAGAPL